MKYTTLSELNILRKVTPENVEKVIVTLKDNLEKGLITEELHTQATNQLKSLVEKAGGDTTTFDTIVEKEDSEEEESDDEIEKGGEGSRGGKIIGHTKSGKPVYDSASHEGHKDFTKEDHHDAANHQDKLSTREYRKFNKTRGNDEPKYIDKDSKGYRDAKAKYEHHRDQYFAHIEAKKNI